MIDESLDEQLPLAQRRTNLATERTRLANERTFLSWVRTGLACVGGGVAVVRILTFFHPTHHFLAKIAGLALIVVGMVIFLFAFLDYRESYLKLDLKGVGANTVWFMGLVVASFCAISTILLLILLTRERETGWTGFAG